MLSIMGSFILGEDDAASCGPLSMPWNKTGGGKDPGDGGSKDAAERVGLLSSISSMRTSQSQCCRDDMTLCVVHCGHCFYYIFNLFESMKYPP